jgi:hypothetical protein
MKLDRMLHLAESQRLPLVLLAAGGGGRPGDVQRDDVVVHGGDEADPKAGKRMRLVKIVTVVHPGGRAEPPVRSVITDKTVLDAYRKAQTEGTDLVKAVLAAQGPAGKLPYPLVGMQPALVSGRAMKPELLERRQKEAAKREERKKREREGGVEGPEA